MSIVPFGNTFARCTRSRSQGTYRQMRSAAGDIRRQSGVTKRVNRSCGCRSSSHNKCPNAAALKIAAGFIGALRSSGKDVIDRHDDRGRFAGTVPVNRTQLGIIKDECPTQLLRWTELPAFHRKLLDSSASIVPQPVKIEVT
jgi:hypothetical protein